MSKKYKMNVTKKENGFVLKLYEVKYKIFNKLMYEFTFKNQNACTDTMNTIKKIHGDAVTVISNF